MVKLELHIHSTFSDGELVPKEIVDIALQKNIKILSFTDHDEIGAYHEVLGYGGAHGLTLIPGIELNTDGEDGELHILGYFFDPNHPKISAYIAWRKEERKEWVKKIIVLLHELGYRITFDEVRALAPGDIIVRTHIAQALVKCNYFLTAEDAYETLLIKGRPAFVQRSPFSAKEAIDLIHTCGGEAYLAHPGAYSFSFDVNNLLSYGIDGIEVFHSKHSVEDQTYWYNFAVLHQLKISGGSDHHGPYSRNPYSIGSVQLDDSSKRYWLEKIGVIE
jgi:predicted metal-dependent phosphoesterase TrpH